MAQALPRGPATPTRAEIHRASTQTSLPKHSLASSWAAALALLAIASACAPGGESGPAPVTPFQFKLSDGVILDARVLLDGQPLANAVVQVHGRTAAPVLEAPGVDEQGQPLPQEIPAQYTGTLPLDAGGGLLFIGATDAQGRLHAQVFAPTAIEWFDVLVARKGASGPFTDAAWAAESGPFSAASRTTWSADGLRQVRIELMEVRP